MCGGAGEKSAGVTVLGKVGGPSPEVNGVDGTACYRHLPSLFFLLQIDGLLG